MTTVRRTAYLLLSLATGTAWFVAFVTLLPLGAGLAITLVGLPILVGTLYLIRPLARFERTLARVLLDEEIESHYRRPERPGRWPAIQARLADPQTWKDFVFLMMQMPLGVFSFAAAVCLIAVPLWFLAAPAFYWAIDFDGEEGIDLGLARVDTLPESLAMSAVGVPIAYLAIVLLRLLGRAAAAWALLLLSSTPDPELTAQVTDARSAQARIIEAGDAERRRLERDLHDGAQQRLVALSLKLGMAKSRLSDDNAAATLVEEAHAESRAALDELRDLARGIHPAVLTDRGLRPALEALARRSSVPAELTDAPDVRLPPAIEAAAYFVVNECLANVAKYSEAEQATVAVREQVGTLVVEVVDDGRGGADPAAGSGLRGLVDRVGALDGTLEVVSPPGVGTRVRAELPLTVRPVGSA